jgi:hypothetical protein
MNREINQEHEQVRHRYGFSPRHTMQVDYDPYISTIKKAMRQGRKRETLKPLVQREICQTSSAAIVTSLS